MSGNPVTGQPNVRLSCNIWLWRQPGCNLPARNVLDPALNASAIKLFGLPATSIISDWSPVQGARDARVHCARLVAVYLTMNVSAAWRLSDDGSRLTQAPVVQLLLLTCA